MSDFKFKRSFGPTPKYDRVLNYKRPNNNFIKIAGPCSCETPEQINKIAEYVAKAGATHLRSGIFRAGTYVGNSFGYVPKDLIEAYANAAKKNGLYNIIEVLNYEDWSIDFINEHCTHFQIGCRQTQNYSLLRKIGKYKKPVFLKRHPGIKLDELLGAAEHCLAGGVEELYLIERGSVSHLNHVRWDLSISLIPAIKKICDIPILVDASHGTGRRDLVAPMTLAGIASGADGCLVETHYDPDNSLSDSEQAINQVDFEELMAKVLKLRELNLWK